MNYRNHFLSMHEIFVKLLCVISLIQLVWSVCQFWLIYDRPSGKMTKWRFFTPRIQQIILSFQLKCQWYHLTSCWCFLMNLLLQITGISLSLHNQISLNSPNYRALLVTTRTKSRPPTPQVWNSRSNQLK
jgi:hypothetical protein